jgi:hypothetical protein
VPVGDVTDLLSGVDGCVVCARDVKRLARELTHVLRCSQRTNGRMAITQKGLDLPNVARRVVDVYQDVLSRRRAQAA